jgi:hypothetical protein
MGKEAKGYFLKHGYTDLCCVGTATTWWYLI